MQNPLEFYKSEKHVFENQLHQVKKKLTISSALRLTVFALIVAGVYFFFGNVKAIMLTVFIGVSVFLFLVSKHTDLQLVKDKLLALIKINKIEIDVFNNKIANLDSGKEYINAQHEFSYDIDLFGDGSFFQYLNRTSLNSGKERLANILTENSITNISNKQEALEELSKKAKWRQNFSATANLINVDIKSEFIVKWLQNSKPFLPSVIKFIPTLFLIVSLSLFVLKYFNYIGFSYIIIWFFIGLVISGVYLKKVNSLYHHANNAKTTFKQYYQLLLEIEKEKFTSVILKEKQHKVKTASKKASVLFNEFSQALDALDQRNNIFFGILGNAFALWDLKQCYKIEQWIALNKHQVEEWFEVITFFDTYNSLANYVFNHPKHSFPEISNKENLTIESKQLGHPLLNAEKRVNNDFVINNQEFFIITGANMAGKSTFLRTVSLSIVMANIGLPVCAENYTYSPVHLITSMRTSDSLIDDESYFFSELKRLKFIVDAINPKTATKNYFIILDEILKGTNSKDKAIGSRKFVEKLVKSNSTGIIATHDLSLCEITKKLTQVKNYYFDAEIINDELYFDYTFKNGICQNMNASFLLKKMEII